MLVTALPTLLPADYPGANCLRREIVVAKDYAANYPNSAAVINAFLSSVAGVAPGSVVLAPASTTVAALVNFVDPTLPSGVTLNAKVSVVSGAVKAALNESVGIVTASTMTFGSVPFVFTIANNLITNITVAALLSKVITSGVKVPCGTVTGSGTFATPTIVNGVITGIVLSAS